MKTAVRRIADGYSIDDFLVALCDGLEVFALQAGERNQYHLVRSTKWDAEKHTLGAYRQIEPLKSILFQPREYLGAAFQENVATETTTIDRIVVGVKNCDLAGKKIRIGGQM